MTAKWFPCNKGGEYRRWYGNNDYVIDWENDGYKLKNFRHPDGRQKSRSQNLQYMKREGLTYKSLKYKNTETYYLVITDESGLQIKREEFQIDIAFAVDEFNFFV